MGMPLHWWGGPPGPRGTPPSRCRHTGVSSMQGSNRPTRASAADHWARVPTIMAQARMPLHWWGGPPGPRGTPPSRRRHTGVSIIQGANRPTRASAADHWARVPIIMARAGITLIASIPRRPGNRGGRVGDFRRDICAQPGGQLAGVSTLVEGGRREWPRKAAHSSHLLPNVLQAYRRRN